MREDLDIMGLLLPVAELASHFQSSSMLKDIPFQVLTKDKATSVPIGPRKFS